MLSPHRLPLRSLDALASGLGSPSTIAALRPAQASLRLIGLRALLDVSERAGLKDHLAGFELLSDVQQQNPDLAAEVLSYPFVGSWVAHCLRLLVGDSGDHASLRADLAHLSGIAAAAAIRAGGPFSIEVPVRQGGVFLPTLGALMMADGPAVTIQRNDEDTVADGALLTGAPNWQPLRRIVSVVSGQALTLLLDDTDPFRGASRLPVAPRLDDVAAREWEQSLGQAWDILVRHHPGYAGAIGAGLAAIVPLAVTPPNQGMSATSRESFGAIAMSPASDPLMLAAGIVHEFQHSKLNAVLDLLHLFGPDDRNYYAPWRRDPRPLPGLLHGAYAYLGVADFWRVQGATPATPFPAYAQMEFARWSDGTGRAIDTLLGSGSLTPAGERFVRGMRQRLRSWPETVPGEPARLARSAAADHRLGWRLRNVRPDATAVEALACAWRQGTPPPMGMTMRDSLTDGGIALGESSRLSLLYLRLRDPGRLTGPEHATGIERADAELVRGNLAAAAAGYLECIRQEPRCTDPWAGLALAWGDTRPALLHAPELVRAVYSRLAEADGQAPDLGMLAEWIAPAAPADPFQLSGPVSPSPFR
jgi:HEXXH motif-containing protein